MKKEIISIEELIKTIQNQEGKLDNKMEIDSLKQENQYLKEKLDYLIRQKFTSKSEKFVNQPSLFGDEVFFRGMGRILKSYYLGMWIRSF